MLDTNVVVAALRSPAGASAELLRLARADTIVVLVNVALALEYEATCLQPEHGQAAGLDEQEVRVFVDAVLAIARPIESHYTWRPQLRDPADDLVLEAAVNGRASAIVTFNRRDFGKAPQRFGIDVLTPAETIRRISR